MSTNLESVPTTVPYVALLFGDDTPHVVMFDGVPHAAVWTEMRPPTQQSLTFTLNGTPDIQPTKTLLAQHGLQTSLNFTTVSFTTLSAWVLKIDFSPQKLVEVKVSCTPRAVLPSSNARQTTLTGAGDTLTFGVPFYMMGFKSETTGNLDNWIQWYLQRPINVLPRPFHTIDGSVIREYTYTSITGAEHNTLLQQIGSDGFLFSYIFQVTYVT